MRDAPDHPSVLHLIDTGGPGGAETVFLELASGLRDRGWHGAVVAPIDDWLAAELRDRGFQPRILDSSRSFDLGYLRALRDLAVEGGFDLVQTHLLGSSVYGTLATLGSDVPVVSTFHGVPDISATDRLRDTKTRILSGARNHAVMVSRFLLDSFRRKRLFDPPSASIIPNGIDCARFAPGPSGVRAELGIEPEAPVVGAVGNMRPAKAYDVLIRAFERISAERPDARLVIAGQGGNEIEASLRRLAGEAGLEGRVIFAGFREDVAELMRAFDVYALSSSDEGFSLTTVQAMATGLPVVATRCGGPEEIIAHPSQGVLVDNGSPEALSTAVLSLLADRGRAGALGRAGREHVEATYSLGAMVDGYERLYRSLIGSGRSTATDSNVTLRS